MLRSLYECLPKSIQPLVAKQYHALNRTDAYRRIHPTKQTQEQVDQSFVEAFFDDRREFETYATELSNGKTGHLRRQALEEYTSYSNDIGSNAAVKYYALIRKYQPEKIIETGVLHGYSTLFILLALRKNGRGELHSIDLPNKTDTPSEEFFGNGSISNGLPADKEPGWLVPQELHDRWNLYLGKSQRLLPEVITDLGDIDFFFHDSEHTIACMLLEFELAWEWLNDGGIIVSDDIDKNSAFDDFIRCHMPTRRGIVALPVDDRITRIGYIQKGH